MLETVGKGAKAEGSAAQQAATDMDPRLAEIRIEFERLFGNRVEQRDLKVQAAVYDLGGGLAGDFVVHQICVEQPCTEEQLLNLRKIWFQAEDGSTDLGFHTPESLRSYIGRFPRFEINGTEYRLTQTIESGPGSHIAVCQRGFVARALND